MYQTSRVLAASAVALGCAYRTSCSTHTRVGSTSAISSSLACTVRLTPAPWQHVRHVCSGMSPQSHCPSPLHVALLTAARRQHTDTAKPAATAAAPAGGEPQAQKDGVHVDPRRLPSTIPGVSQEELAARITAYHTQKAQEASELSSKAVAQEVELMRRSLSPSDFEAYMQSLEKGMAAVAKEQAKLAAMSPVELHQYQQKKKRQAVRYEWYKTFLMIFALLGSTALLFSLFLFFE
jgi:hypothetical protein